MLGGVPPPPPGVGLPPPGLPELPPAGASSAGSRSSSATGRTSSLIVPSLLQTLCLAFGSFSFFVVFDAFISTIAKSFIWLLNGAARHTPSIPWPRALRSKSLFSRPLSLSLPMTRMPGRSLHLPLNPLSWPLQPLPHFNVS
ncbi:hypothetical protein DF156_27065 [Burkholderia ubonensis]|nr:hypothetical protein DF155_26265 [Burkholderia ubonensis]RQP31867.1 hypothetical protein DF154_28525 [Burkholderia ubonensis]RQP34374.1 hypothetical protein DF156_27065 [Burkholderia ubonensis]RQP49418.1 hypothetical protein DF144_25220 [Burkholderia ubonensis]RQP53425.1 hypothetical protein DF151_26550 [Burkholderia ubonensis]